MPSPVRANVRFAVGPMAGPPPLFIRPVPTAPPASPSSCQEQSPERNILTVRPARVALGISITRKRNAKTQ
jgi:hypothetical protein